MRKRILSFILALIITAGVIPISPLSVSYADGDFAGVGTEGNTSGGGQTGGWLTSKAGYRIYILDENGQQVSNAVDFLFSDPAYIYSEWNRQYCWNTKLEDLRTDGTENIKVKIPYIQSGYFDEAWPVPIYAIGKTMYPNGDDVRDWFLRGEKSLHVDSGTIGNVVHYNPSKPSTGTSKPSTGTSNGTSSKPSTSQGTQTKYKIASEIRSGMWSAFNNAKALGLSKSQAVAKASKFGKDKYDKLYLQQLYGDDDLVYWNTAIQEVIDEMDKIASWDSPKKPTKPSKPSKADKPTTALPNKHDKDKDKGFFETIIDGIGSLFSEAPTQSNNTLLISYADEDDRVSNENGNLAKVLDLDVGGGPLFTFTNNWTIELALDGKPSIAQTVCNNKGYVMVEPVFFFVPATAKSAGNGVYVADKTAKYMWYGTPTNYAQFMKREKNDGRFNTGTGAGMYASVIYGVGHTCLYLDEPLDTQKTKISALTESEASKKVDRDILIDTSKGYALHYYKTESSKGLPSIPTYNRYDPTPDQPHPPQDPEIPQKGGTIKLLPSEDPENYKEHSRRYNIVKVYEYETLDGVVQHVATEYREHTPGEVYIQHEPDWKVVEYFTSVNYYGDIHPIVEDTLWEQIVAEIEPTDEITKIDAKKLPENEVLAGTTVNTAKIGIYCDCEPSVADDPTSAKHYRDTTVYVRLLKWDDPPSTHTWDYDYPLDPNPAPEPPPLPEIPDIPPEEVELIFPYNVNIVKTYRTLDKDTGVYEHDGTYVRTENPGRIQVEDEKAYKLKKWFVSTDYLNPGYEMEWEQIEQNAPVTGESGTSEKFIHVQEPNTTLYLLLEREKKSTPPPNSTPNSPLSEDITESQLVKISRTNNKHFNWSGYTFQADIEAAITSHAYSKHITYFPFHQDTDANCAHVTRARGDHVISATFGILSKDSHETSVANPSAHQDFDGKMYGKGVHIAIHTIQ